MTSAATEPPIRRAWKPALRRALLLLVGVAALCGWLLVVPSSISASSFDDSCTIRMSYPNFVQRKISSLRPFKMELIHNRTNQHTVISQFMADPASDTGAIPKALIWQPDGKRFLFVYYCAASQNSPSSYGGLTFSEQHGRWLPDWSDADAAWITGALRARATSQDAGEAELARYLLINRDSINPVACII